MKKILFIGIVLLSIIVLQSCGTTKPVVIEPVVKVVKIEGKSQKELYIRANTWMVETFKNADSVIQFSDKENGIVTGKYLLSTLGLEGSGMSAKQKNVFALIKIQVKDGASKITISPDSFMQYMNKNYTKAKAQIDIESLILDFEKSIKETESNDW